MMKFLQLNDLLTSKKELFPKCSYIETFKSDFSMWFHRHETVEIMYAVNKDFIVYYYRDSDPSQPYKITIPKNHLIVINSGITHQLNIAEDDTKIINIEFIYLEKGSMGYSFDSSGLYNLEAFKNFVVSNKQVYVIDCNKGTVKLLENIQQELLIFPPNIAQIPFTDIFFLNNLHLHYWTISFFYEITKKFATKNQTSSTSNIVKKAIDYINENIKTDNITPQKVSEYLHVNQSYLSSAFSKQMSITLCEYINRKRISFAIHLLSTTTFPINQIAIQAGYNNRQHFIRQFKKLLGITPIEFRKTRFPETIKTHPNNEQIYQQDKFVPPQKIDDNRL